MSESAIIMIVKTSVRFMSEMTDFLIDLETFIHLRTIIGLIMYGKREIPFKMMTKTEKIFTKMTGRFTKILYKTKTARKTKTAARVNPISLKR